MSFFRPNFLNRMGDQRVILFALGYIAFLSLLMALGFAVGPQKIRRLVGLPYTGPTIIKNLPDMSIQAATVDSGAGGIKLSLSLEIGNEDGEKLQKYMPMIMDRINVCLNNATNDEIADSGSFRLLREHIRRETNKVSGPVEVLNIYVRKVLAVKSTPNAPSSAPQN